MAELFTDEILGTVHIRRNALSRSIRMRLSARGEIIATAPKRTPVFLIKQAIVSSRARLIEMRQQAGPEQYLVDQKIGQSHSLAIVSSSLMSNPTVALRGRTIVATLNDPALARDEAIQSMIREQVAKVLRKEAKAYLPRRLATLADRFGYSYSTVRFPHATSRWGSCSTSGAISLNIALMKLPLELIDYVIIHELAHTKHMNHSTEFWREVGMHDTHYKLHRRQIKSYSPII